MTGGCSAAGWPIAVCSVAGCSTPGCSLSTPGSVTTCTLIAARARFKISQPFSSRLRRAFWPRLRFLLSAKSRYSGASACGKSSALSISSKAIFKAVSPSSSLIECIARADGDAPLRRPIELDWAVASAAGSVPSTAVPSLQHFASMRPGEQSDRLRTAATETGPQQVVVKTTTFSEAPSLIVDYYGASLGRFRPATIARCGAAGAAVPVPAP